VTGAALGIRLVDEVAGAVAVLVTVAVGVAVAGAGELELTPGVPGVPDVPVLPDEGELPEEADAVTDPEVVTDGEKVGTVGVVEDVVEVHAETATRASRVRAPQHMAVSLARSGVPAIVLRTFMDPPHAPGR
jgi:hypothetical protein